MSQEFWWEKQGYVNYLVDIAAALDREYAGRAVYAIGNSPSWLVYALGRIRHARGLEPRVGYIPHSGSLHELPFKEALQNADEHDTLHYGLGRNKRVSPGGISTYFNFLARYHVDPHSIQQTYGAHGRPVLVDFLAKGNGFASFLRLYNDMAEKQKTPTLVEGGFDIVAYKMSYCDRMMNMAVAPIDPDDTEPRTFPVRIISGDPGRLVNVLAGVTGYVAPDDQYSRRRDAGRFMPYYPVGDKYSDENPYMKNYAPPVHGLRMAPPDHALHVLIKTRIAAAVDLYNNAPAQHQAQCQLARRSLDNAFADWKSYDGKPSWVVLRGYH